MDEGVRLYRERYSTIGKFENSLIAGHSRHAGRRSSTRGYFLSVATSKLKTYAGDIIDHFDLRRYFQVLHGSELDGQQCGEGRPRSATSSRPSGSRPANAVMIGDRSHDIVGASSQRRGSRSACSGATATAPSSRKPERPRIARAAVGIARPRRSGPARGPTVCLTGHATAGGPSSCMGLGTSRVGLASSGPGSYIPANPRVPCQTAVLKSMADDRLPRDPLKREAMALAARPARPFIHLRVHSAYSLLEGALPLGKIVGHAVKDERAGDRRHRHQQSVRRARICPEGGEGGHPADHRLPARSRLSGERERRLAARPHGARARSCAPVVLIAATEAGYAQSGPAGQPRLSRNAAGRGRASAARRCWTGYRDGHDLPDRRAARPDRHVR